MPEEQLSALLHAVLTDTELQEKIKGAEDLDAALAIAKEAGFEINEEDWLRYQQEQSLSDEELEGMAGGASPVMDNVVVGPTAYINCRTP